MAASAPKISRPRGYSDLFPPCRTDGCHDIADGLDGTYCGKCHSDREWQRCRQGAETVRQQIAAGLAFADALIPQAE